MTGTLSKEEKKILFLLKEKEDLLYQVQVSESAIDFWEKQMRAVFGDMDENDENKWHPDYQDNMDSLADKIKSLVARGRIETETIDKLEKRCNDLSDGVTDFMDGFGKLKKVKKIIKKHIKKKN